MLRDDIRRRRDGLRLCGLTPPKRRPGSDKVRESPSARLAASPRSRRTASCSTTFRTRRAARTPRAPFPFLPTLEPLDYSRDFLAALRGAARPLQVRGQPERGGACGLGRRARGGRARRVRARRSALERAGRGALGLRTAYELLGRRATPAAWAGSPSPSATPASSTRTSAWSARAAGCRFFVSQTVFDAGATKSLLSDYALALRGARLDAGAVHPQFSPCGSVKTMEFMKWLGISFPRWLENELRTRADILRQVGRPGAADLRRLARLREEKGSPRHQRRERLDPQGGDRGLGRALRVALGDDVAGGPSRRSCSAGCFRHPLLKRLP